jgi:hypothetical protein
LHGIVHCHTGGDHPAWTIDVHVDGFFRGFGFEEEELGGYDGCHLVGYGSVDADDSFTEEAGVDVETSFAGGAVLEDYGDIREMPASLLLRM